MWPVNGTTLMQPFQINRPPLFFDGVFPLQISPIKQASCHASNSQPFSSPSMPSFAH